MVAGCKIDRNLLHTKLKTQYGSAFLLMEPAFFYDPFSSFIFLYKISQKTSIMSETQKNRILSFKNNSKNSQEMRARRLETTVELRKSKKEDQLSKRRNIEDDDITSPLKENNGQLHQSPISMTLDEILQGMASTNVEINFEATQGARKMLSRERNPPIDLLISRGIVPICVKFLDNDDQ